MAFTFGFFNSLKGDRRYDANQFGELFDGILRDGILSSVGQVFAVTTANNGMQINVGTGRAWFNHTWSKNDSIMVLTVSPSDTTRARYDAVVLEVNQHDEIRANSIKIVQGEPLVNPVKPSLVNTDKIHQYPLAYIRVEPAVEVIAASKIENMVGREPTIFATGVLDAVKIDDLWAQWKGEFNEWFDNIKAQLSGNIVANLQNQIDSVRASVPFKATNAETVIGADTSKYTTPSGVKAAIDSNLKYVSDENDVKYRLIEKDVLPRLKPDAIVKSKFIDGTVTSDGGISPTNLKEGLLYATLHLKDYDVTHDTNTVLVVDDQGYSRIYTFSFTVDGFSGYLCAIRDTNQYFAIGHTGSGDAMQYILYRITVSSGTPTVSKYYTWDANDGEIVSLLYVNTNYSVLIINSKSFAGIRVYRISNLYVEQPTIFTNIVDSLVEPSTNNTGYPSRIVNRWYSVTRTYIVQLRYEAQYGYNASGKPGDGYRKDMFTCQYISIENGTISSPQIIRSDIIPHDVSASPVMLQVFSDLTGNCYFIIEKTETTAAINNKYYYLITFSNLTITNKVLSSINSSIASIPENLSPHFSFSTKDIDGGYVYFYITGYQFPRDTTPSYTPVYAELKFICSLNVKTGTMQIRQSPYNQIMVTYIPGASNHVSINANPSISRTTARPHFIVNPIITDEPIGLESSQIVAVVANANNNYLYAHDFSYSVPVVLYRERYLYCLDNGYTPSYYRTNIVRYDLESRTFIGIPVK